MSPSFHSSHDSEKDEPLLCVVVAAATTSGFASDGTNRLHQLLPGMGTNGRRVPRYGDITKTLEQLHPLLQRWSWNWAVTTAASIAAPLSIILGCSKNTSFVQKGCCNEWWSCTRDKHGSHVLSTTTVAQVSVTSCTQGGRGCKTHRRDEQFPTVFCSVHSWFH